MTKVKKCASLENPSMDLKTSFSKLKHPIWWCNQSFSFIRNMDESCVYKKANGSAIIVFILYVDDILLMGNDKEWCL